MLPTSSHRPVYDNSYGESVGRPEPQYTADDLFKHGKEW